METVFDHNITKEEWRNLMGCELDEYEKSEYFELTDQDDAFKDLAYLFYYRGDEKKAKKYIDKTKDIECIASFWRTVKHP